MVELNEADTPLHQPSGQQAIVGEGHFSRLDPVQLLDVLWLLPDLHQLGDTGLHPVG